MAGLIDNGDSLEEGRSLLRTNLFNLENLLLPNHNVAHSVSSPHSNSSIPKTTGPRDALVTSPPNVLELRQNNPQDCSNLITASVNRATVEISRTIIALNATFTQQLQQASIDKSNGIKSAQDSATSTINVVVLSASSVTSSAFSSLTIANLAVTSANFALSNAQASASTAIAAANSSITLANLAVTSISSASSSDVSTLSSSLYELQSSLTSVQASASAAIAAAQSALAFASGSAAAQASSILASAASATVGLVTFSPQSQLPTLELPKMISLSPTQAGAIVAGAVVLTILLSMSVYFLATKMKKSKERDSYLDEKDGVSSPKKLPSRLSSALRTGNSMTLKFNPPKTSDAPPPPRPALRKAADRSPTSSTYSTQTAEAEEFSTSKTFLARPSWPLSTRVTRATAVTTTQPLSPAFTSFWPLKFDEVHGDKSVSSILPSQGRKRDTPNLNLLDTIKKDDTIPYKSPRLKETFDNLDNSSSPDVPEKKKHELAPAPTAAPQTLLGRETLGEIVFDPFEDDTDEAAEVGLHDSNFSEPSEQQNPVETPIERPSESSQIQEDHISISNATNPSEDPVLASGKEEPAIQQANKDIPAPDRPTEPEVKQEPREWSFEQLLPQQSKRVPAPETLALLRKDDQPRESTVPEIDELLRIVAQVNEHLADKPLFWSDFRPVEEEVEMAMEMPPAREHEIVRVMEPTEEVSAPEADEDAAVNREQRETTLSSFLEGSSVRGGPAEEQQSSPQLQSPHQTEEPEQAPTSTTGERDISPLRRNPQIRNITSMLADNEAVSVPNPTIEDEELDEHVQRGRSMLRTSDIVEARLSARVSAIEQARYSESMPAAEHTKELRDRTMSPLRRNPVDIATVLEQRNRTLSPLQRNPSTSTSQSKRRSRSLSPPSLPKLNSLSPAPPSREESPLRRNPFHPSNATLLPSELTLRAISETRPKSNFVFNQTLSKFQTLAAAEERKGRQASTEVTQRAIAGIYIPGSLREQAVRNLSKIRERSRMRNGDVVEEGSA